jgi:hypothetical protein
MMAPDVRPAGMSREQFDAAWHDLSAFAMTLPLWGHLQRYSHWHLVDPDKVGWRDTPLMRMLPEEFGGVSVAQFEDAEAVARFTSDPSYPQLTERFEQELGYPSHERFEAGRFFLGREVVVVEDDTPPAVSHVGFLRRRPNLSRKEFLETWHAFATANFVGTPAIRAQFLAYSQFHALIPGEGEPDDAGFDGVLRVTFSEPAAMLRMYEAAGEADLGRQTFYDETRSLFFMVTETVLYDAEDETGAAAHAHAAH